MSKPQQTDIDDSASASPEPPIEPAEGSTTDTAPANTHSNPQEPQEQREEGDQSSNNPTVATRAYPTNEFQMQQVEGPPLQKVFDIPTVSTPLSLNDKPLSKRAEAQRKYRQKKQESKKATAVRRSLNPIIHPLSRKSTVEVPIPKDIQWKDSPWRVYGESNPPIPGTRMSRAPIELPGPTQSSWRVYGESSFAKQS
ncbi:hypothetical protein D9758_008539 [Tetrapyrgos nigripes]|uniref:Uncharacterized protein n=1 Tax=Tetrapyrgos nigripes TaxID=182062 RepID=A0A8H5G5R2_9AGAR|nr:hypothetical protein D9758_008539 [Tetrapyrgos nigripes]